MTFAKRLDPDQARQNAGSDRDPNRLALVIVFLKEFFLKATFEKKISKQQMHEKLPSMQRVFSFQFDIHDNFLKSDVWIMASHKAQGVMWDHIFRFIDYSQLENQLCVHYKRMHSRCRN